MLQVLHLRHKRIKGIGGHGELVDAETGFLAFVVADLGHLKRSLFHKNGHRTFGEKGS
ncbi:hypothetical protein D3C72_2078270 [compost metagenome]